MKNRLEEVFQKVLGTTEKNTPLSDLNQRYNLFIACSEQLQHNIPNSMLHTIETLEDVQKFYETPICTTTPLDKMRNMDLPENLHIQFEYHRFHPGKKVYAVQLFYTYITESNSTYIVKRAVNAGNSKECN